MVWSIEKDPRLVGRIMLLDKIPPLEFAVFFHTRQSLQFYLWKRRSQVEAVKCVLNCTGCSTGHNTLFKTS